MDFKAKSEVGDSSVLWKEVEMKWIKDIFMCHVL